MCVYIYIYIYTHNHIFETTVTVRRLVKKLPKSSLGQQFLMDSGEFMGCQTVI